MTYEPDDIRTGYDQIQVIARLATLIDLPLAQAILDSMHFIDSLMPITDPTTWMKLRKTAPDHQKLAAAFVQFRATLEELRPKEEP